MANNLYEFYTSQGKTLPSVQERERDATKAGIQNYSGTAEQNTTLLNYLKNPIDLSKMNGTNVNLPTPSVDNTDYSGIVTGGQSQMDALAKLKQEDKTGIMSMLDEYSRGDTAGEDTYNKLNQDLGIDQKKEAERLAMQDLGILEAKLKGITNKATAANLALQNQGGAITSGGVELSSNANLREAAIESLPVQAEIMLAQAKLTGSQTALKDAQDKLNTLFKLKSDDLDRKHEDKMRLFDYAIQFADKKEERAIEAKKAEAEREYETKRDALKFEQEKELIKYKESFNGTTGTGASSEAKSWANLIASGQAKLSDVPANLKTSVAQALSTSTGTGNDLQIALTKNSIDEVDSIISDPAMRSAVGPTGIARFIGRGLDSATGSRQKFIASVEQLRSKLTLDSLINAKAQGATFGALSEGELGILSSSASKLGTWAIVKDGKTTGYKASEKDFKAEIEKINNFAKLDYILKGGNPADVNAQTMTDGSIVVKNSDGTFTKLR